MTQLKLATAALLAASAAPIFASAPATSPTTVAIADLNAQAEAILKAAYPSGRPGASAIITRNGKVVYASGRGFADVDAQRPITPDTVFQLGSIAKQFTAAVILQLVSEHRMSLDDPLSKYFPDWPQPGGKATIRQLLNHTSGIKDFSKIPGWIGKNSAREVSTDELIELTKSLGSKAEPGAEWEYNNGGYVVLGGIVEKVTGKPWHDAVDKRIASPLGLKTLAYAVDAARSGELAQRYRMEDGRPQPTGTINMSIAGAAGGLVASVADMARWSEALNNGKVVPGSLYKEMISPAKLADGSTEPYGFALHLRRIMGHDGFEHGGAGRGIDTDSIYIPDSKLFVGVFSNSDDLPTDSSDVLRRLAALAVGSPLPTFTEAQIDPKAVEPAFGVYKGDEAPDIRFFTRGGRLYIARGDYELQFLPASATTFYSANGALNWAKLARDPAGNAVLEMYGTREVEPNRYVRTGPIPADAVVKVPAAILRSYVGDYDTEVLSVTVRLGPDGWLTMTPKGEEAMPMRAVSETEFMMDGNKMRVVFHPKDGKVDSFTIHRGARELHGKRVVK